VTLSLRTTSHREPPDVRFRPCSGIAARAEQGRLRLGSRHGRMTGHVRVCLEVLDVARGPQEAEAERAEEEAGDAVDPGLGAEIEAAHGT
jgi:hypothetical protein